MAKWKAVIVVCFLWIVIRTNFIYPKCDWIIWLILQKKEYAVLNNIHTSNTTQRQIIIITAWTKATDYATSNLVLISSHSFSKCIHFKNISFMWNKTYQNDMEMCSGEWVGACVRVCLWVSERETWTLQAQNNKLVYAKRYTGI